MQRGKERKDIREELGKDALVDDQEVDEDDKVDEYLHEQPLDGSTASALQWLRDRDEIGKDQFSHFKKESQEGGVMEMSTGDDDIKIEYNFMILTVV